MKLGSNNHGMEVLSQPKLKQQLSSTEFEVRLHSYREVHHHPPPHKLNLYTQNWEELTELLRHFQAT